MQTVFHDVKHPLQIVTEEVIETIFKKQKETHDNCIKKVNELSAELTELEKEIDREKFDDFKTTFDKTIKELKENNNKIKENYTFAHDLCLDAFTNYIKKITKIDIIGKYKDFLDEAYWSKEARLAWEKLQEKAKKLEGKQLIKKESQQTEDIEEALKITEIKTINENYQAALTEFIEIGKNNIEEKFKKNEGDYKRQLNEIEEKIKNSEEKFNEIKKNLASVEEFKKSINEFKKSLEEIKEAYAKYKSKFIYLLKTIFSWGFRFKKRFKKEINLVDTIIKEITDSELTKENLEEKKKAIEALKYKPKM